MHIHLFILLPVLVKLLYVHEEEIYSFKKAETKLLSEMLIFSLTILNSIE
jgi:hypothetical protein